MSGYLGPDSTTWKIGSEAVLAFGGARAVLMQLAHPLVAMGVSEHSLQITSALLPAPVREIFDLKWSPRRQKVFDLSTAIARLILPRLPAPLRTFPITRRMMAGH